MEGPSHGQYKERPRGKWHSGSGSFCVPEPRAEDLPCRTGTTRADTASSSQGLPFNTGPSLKLSVVLVGVMAVFRHMLKVPNAGPLSVGSFGHIGVIEIGICGGRVFHGNSVPTWGRAACESCRRRFPGTPLWWHKSQNFSNLNLTGCSGQGPDLCPRF